jgi:ABC-type amino acid transport substrate-binding protein
MANKIVWFKEMATFFVTVFALMIISQAALATCTIKLGYRLEDKSPFMAGGSDNSGLYKEIYTRAAKAINCKLVIIRKPKNRILAELNAGKVDIYPAYNYTEKRARKVFYLETGLVKRNVGISLHSLPDITHLTQLKGHTAMLALGSLDRYKDFQGIDVRWVADLSIDKVISFLKRERADFYFANLSEYLYAIKQLSAEQAQGLKVHHNCCGKERIVYFALSKKSPLIKELPNPRFIATQAISPTNFPTILDLKSTAYRFNQALQQMKKQGMIEDLYNHYFR